MVWAKQKIVSGLKLPNKISYNELIIAQEDTVCFQLVEEAKTIANSFGDAKQVWMSFKKILSNHMGFQGNTRQ